MVHKNIKLRVKNLVNKTGTANPIEIASMLRIPIVYTSLPDKIKGYLVRPVRRKTIVINDSLDDREAYIVVAHELDHAMLHGATNSFHADTASFTRSRDEYEANLFALYLLSYSFDIDERLLQAAPGTRDVIPAPEAHRLLCRCLDW